MSIALCRSKFKGNFIITFSIFTTKLYTTRNNQTSNTSSYLFTIYFTNSSTKPTDPTNDQTENKEPTFHPTVSATDKPLMIQVYHQLIYHQLKQLFLPTNLPTVTIIARSNATCIKYLWYQRISDNLQHILIFGERNMKHYESNVKECII